MKKKYINLILLLMILVIAFTLYPQLRNANDYTFNYSRYKTLAYEDNSGEINVTLEAPWLRKKVIEAESKIILLRLKEDILTGEYEDFTGIRVIYLYEETEEKIYEIYVNKATLLEVNWAEEVMIDVPKLVNYVYWDKNTKWEEKEE